MDYGGFLGPQLGTHSSSGFLLQTRIGWITCYDLPAAYRIYSERISSSPLSYRCYIRPCCEVYGLSATPSHPGPFPRAVPVASGSAPRMGMSSTVLSTGLWGLCSTSCRRRHAPAEARIAQNLGRVDEIDTQISQEILGNHENP